MEHPHNILGLMSEYALRVAIEGAYRDFKSGSFFSFNFIR